MVTGYTKFIEDGTINEAKDFIMLCARATDILAPLRDEPLDAKIPDALSPDEYYKDAYEASINELERINRMTDEDISKIIDEDYEESIRYNSQYLETLKELNNRYRHIFEGIVRWNPPTRQHQELKTFALKQIKKSRPSKDEIEFREAFCPSKKISPNVWKAKKIEDLAKDISYYKHKMEEEDARTKQRNDWLKQLRDSLNNL